MINVTKTKLPPLRLYNKFLKEIWKNNWVTNNGNLVRKLETDLKFFLKVNNLILVNNGTIGLQIALKSLDLKGQVITTPFTFPATTNVLLWEGLEPVFADIDTNTFNIDPQDVEKKITNKTSAILAVHVYGNPCNVEALETIAKKYDLKLIYDAAHAFGVEFQNKSVLNFGDISVLSFHATKTFHTIEGGALITNNHKLSEQFKLYRNFGIKSEEEILLPGINAKMNEFQAAMGLSNLLSIDQNIIKRRRVYNYYKKNLKNVQFQKIYASKYNYSYMPVVFKNKKTRDKIYKNLLKNDIRARKYFYPLTSDYNFIKKISLNNLNNSKKISDSILCLPIYPEVRFIILDKIIKIINSLSQNKE